MDIIFLDKKLAKVANDHRALVREYGKIRAEKLALRLSQLRAAKTLEDLRYAAGRFHELSATRKGQWACDLDQPYRLVFVPNENPIPVNDSGQYRWDEIKSVSIIEIVNYHKET